MKKTKKVFWLFIMVLLIVDVLLLFLTRNSEHKGIIYANMLILATGGITLQIRMFAGFRSFKNQYERISLLAFAFPVSILWFLEAVNGMANSFLLPERTLAFKNELVVMIGFYALLVAIGLVWRLFRSSWFRGRLAMLRWVLF